MTELEQAAEKLRATERAINEYRVPTETSPCGEFEQPAPTAADAEALARLEAEHARALAHYRACLRAARAETA